MELLQLKYFQVIARTEHISKAAMELQIAQPSLSQTLKRLENEVGTPLFDRIGKHIALNPAGEIFLKYVDEVFTSLDNASIELDTYLSTESKSVSLCIRSASMLLPELFQEIKKVDDSIQLQIFQHQSEDALASGDLFISSSHEKPITQNCTILLTESIVIALPKRHSLASSPKITLQDLSQESFISLSPDSRLYKTVEHYCSAKNFTPYVSTFVDTPNIMRDLLRLNLGIAFIPELTWKDFASDTVVVRKIHDFPMKRYITLSWNDRKFMPPYVLSSKQAIIDYFTRYNLQFQE